MLPQNQELSSAPEDNPDPASPSGPSHPHAPPFSFNQAAPLSRPQLYVHSEKLLHFFLLKQRYTKLNPVFMNFYTHAAQAGNLEVAF